tara:strand:+ start:12945 stop:13130 length:186 start_codon:yes stop_codon:yes gene_type:complete
MYNPEALEAGILKCKDTIEVFEKAIEKERDTIKEYRGMIEVIEKRERTLADFESRVEIDVG